MTKEEYILIKVAEECAEVIQRITKSQTFGLEEIQLSNPKETRNNRERIAGELDDLKTTIKILESVNSLYITNLNRETEKKEKVEKYFQYSVSLGIVTP